MSTDYSRDQGAVDWARGEVERVIAQCKEREAKCWEHGDQVHAMNYRVAANVMTMHLVSTGCVISAFSERGPELRRAMDAEPGLR